MRSLYAGNRKNCDCSDGGLKATIGYQRVTNTNGDVQICPFNNVEKIVAIKVYDSINKRYEERFAFLTTDGELYEQDEINGEYYCSASGLQGADVVPFVGEDFRYVLAFIGENSCVYRRDNGAFDVMLFDKTTKSGCFFGHRMLVGVKPSTIACSAPERELNFAPSIHDGGVIHFPCEGGEIVGVKAFNNRVYLFFEHGIVRLDAVGAIKDFSMEQMDYTGGKIFGKTLCVGQNGIYFMAEDGLYRLEESGVKILRKSVIQPPTEETFNERAFAFSNRVFIRYQTKTGEKTLVVYEDEKDCFYMDALPLFTAEEGGRCLFTDESGVICRLCEGGENCFEGSFLDAKTDFGIAGRKTLTALHFTGEGSFVLRVKTGGRTFLREVAFQNGEALLNLSERGEVFTFDFLLNGGTSIHSMHAQFIITS